MIQDGAGKRDDSCFCHPFLMLGKPLILADLRTFVVDFSVGKRYNYIVYKQKHHVEEIAKLDMVWCEWL